MDAQIAEAPAVQLQEEAGLGLFVVVARAETEASTSAIAGSTVSRIERITSGVCHCVPPAPTIAGSFREGWGYTRGKRGSTNGTAQKQGNSR